MSTRLLVAPAPIALDRAGQLTRVSYVSGS